VQHGQNHWLCARNFLRIEEFAAKRKKIGPHRKFDKDEPLPYKVPKVICLQGKRLVSKVVTAGRGKTITAVCYFSSTNHDFSP
jgi:hypothetical protein